MRKAKDRFRSHVQQRTHECTAATMSQMNADSKANVQRSTTESVCFATLSRVQWRNSILSPGRSEALPLPQGCAGLKSCLTKTALGLSSEPQEILRDQFGYEGFLLF